MLDSQTVIAAGGLKLVIRRKVRPSRAPPPPFLGSPQSGRLLFEKEEEETKLKTKEKRLDAEIEEEKGSDPEVIVISDETCTTLFESSV